MANRWFRLPETGANTTDDPHRPDFFGHDVDGYSGNKSPAENSPIWFVRVYADTTTLDDLANESGVVELSSVPVETFNNLFGQNRNADSWDQAFRVGDS